MTDAGKESLYSFEVAVKTIFLKRAVVCRVPSVAIRFLEYPTLELNLVNDDELAKIRNLIESDPESIAQSPQILQLQHSTGTYAFSQGKSCMIKMKLSELEESLTSIPVYVMVIDVLPSVPKLVASFALSLENAVRKIVRDVSVNGIDMPCAQGERDIFPLYNLMGTKVGEAEMGVRLSSLGINMIQHVSNIAMPESRIAEADKNRIEQNNLPKNKIQVKSPSSTSIRLGCKLKSEAPKKTENSVDKENLVTKEKLMVSDSTQTTKPKMPSKYVQHPIKPQTETLGSTENIFCPPALYYDQKSDTLERDIYTKQQLAITHELQSVDQSIALSDLENYGQDKIIVPSSVVYRSPQPQKKSFASSHATQTETAHAQDFPQSLTEFPILRALVAEVARLGLGQEQAAAPQHVPIVQKPDKKVTKDKSRFSKSRDQLIPLHKSPKKQPECKGPLKFGMTNTMRLRMAMTKATLEQRRKENFLKTSVTQDSLRQSRPARLGRTYDVKSPISKGGKKVKMVSTGCGPDGSMYRRGITRNVQQETVYMGRMTGFEEGGGRAQDEPANDDEFGIEDLMIVKDIGTPRPYSRQSQRSIEIHLPTASTEFTIGKDDDWRSTVSDQEKLMEKLKAAEEDVKNDEPEFYTPPESTDTSRPQSAAQINVTGKDALKAMLTLSNEKFAQSDASDRYKYSDDFDDDKTWSATRTPSAMTPVNSTTIKEEDDGDKEVRIPARPSKSMDSTITTARTSDFASSAGEEFIHELRGASAQKITSSDDALETSSVSRGSVVTALIPARKGGLKVGNITVPEPIPSDSPIIQSINTESGSTENFPEPKKRSLASKSVQRKKKSSTKEVHLPKSVVEIRKSKSRRKEPPVPKPSRLTPSPPSTRRFSPLSSPESSREKIRRMYHHPGRHTRPTSSGSASSDFDKPTSPVRRSDSVSSYQPSEMSDMSIVKLSEELSDILSEETDSQDAAHSIKMNNDMPADGPRTYFGKPKLDPSTKLGYTT